MMEEVLRTGTAAGVRAKYKFDAPAAGKTGTSQAERNGWFAGYTSELLCIVWVGFDDNRPLDIEGAHSAAPIWAEFMKRALNYREYRDTKPFRAPDGIVTIDIDPLSGMPATPQCPNVRPEVYIAGTQPVGLCPLHGGKQGITNISGWSTEPPPAVAPQPAPARPSSPSLSSDSDARRAQRQVTSDPQTAKAADAKEPDQPQKPKKSLLKRIFGAFGKK
jgi:penicillin-binding protein 1B